MTKVQTSIEACHAYFEILKKKKKDPGVFKIQAEQLETLDSLT